MNHGHDDEEVPKGPLHHGQPPVAALPGQWRQRRLTTSTSRCATRFLEYIEDMLGRYDVDGVEFDYMRWCQMVAAGRRAPARRQADRLHAEDSGAAGTQPPRSVGVIACFSASRVPQTLAECDYLGFDVKAWIKTGLVDYVCPSRFFDTGLQLPVEDRASPRSRGAPAARSTPRSTTAAGARPPGPVEPPDERGSHVTGQLPSRGRAQLLRLRRGRAQSDPSSPRACPSRRGGARPAGRDWRGRPRDAYYPSLERRTALLGPSPPTSCTRACTQSNRVKQVPPPSDSLRFRVAEALSDEAVPYRNASVPRGRSGRGREHQVGDQRPPRPGALHQPVRGDARRSFPTTSTRVDLDRKAWRHSSRTATTRSPPSCCPTGRSRGRCWSATSKCAWQRPRRRSGSGRPRGQWQETGTGEAAARRLSF